MLRGLLQADQPAIMMGPYTGIVLASTRYDVEAWVGSVG